MNDFDHVFIGTALSVFIVSTAGLAPVGTPFLKDGAKCTSMFRVTGDGAKRTPGVRIVEDGSDRTAIGRLG
ncbi:hypothetical protein IQ22_00617 [Pseudomonas duriflava]|uniref:Uncharacterized protein n=1 Tax=Pseudomonas duriflava TaxID=459528 RepID=A0A562QKY1_9PSED|nr:hypothetical protein [Pseudomonas duriflava]TWI57401.1 hypothetical protein IQ22_00617 [Pseudomonas duriflava]